MAGRRPVERRLCPPEADKVDARRWRTRFRTLIGVSVRAAPARSPFALAPARRAELLARCERAVRRARRGAGEVLAGITLPVHRATDPSAVVLASRRAGEPWFCFEQPDRHGAAVAALGCARDPHRRA